LLILLNYFRFVKIFFSRFFSANFLTLFFIQELLICRNAAQTSIFFFFMGLIFSNFFFPQRHFLRQVFVFLPPLFPASQTFPYHFTGISFIPKTLHSRKRVSIVMFFLPFSIADISGCTIPLLFARSD